MLYDNVQFISLMAKYFKISSDKYFERKIKQSYHFLMNNFISKDSGLLGSAFDADSDGIEGKYYVYKYDEIKDIKDINKFFDVKPQGNWEGQIILEELKEPNKKVIEDLFKIRQKRRKPFFDNKTQLDHNCIWISSLITLHSVFPQENYLTVAENFLK